MTRRDITPELDAAQAEETGEDHQVVIRGVEFVLPGGSLSNQATVALGRFAKEAASKIPAVQSGSIVALHDAMSFIFGEEQFEKLNEFALSNAEFMVVVNAVTDLYTGGGAGESPGSPGSSQNTGEPQKPISNGSTASISGEPASANHD